MKSTHVKFPQIVSDNRKKSDFVSFAVKSKLKHFSSLLQVDPQVEACTFFRSSSLWSQTKVIVMRQTLPSAYAYKTDVTGGNPCFILCFSLAHWIDEPNHVEKIEMFSQK